MPTQKVEIINSTRKPLPYGFYSRKHLNIFLSIFFFLVALSIFVSIIMYKHQVLNHPLLYIFVELFLILMAFLIAHCFGNPMIPIMRKFYKTGNFNQFRKKTANLLKYKLNTEVAKEIIIYTVLYLFDVNANEAAEIYRLIQAPRAKLNKYLYEITTIKYNTLMGYYDEAEKLIAEFEKNHKNVDKQVLGNKILVQIGKNNVTLKDIDESFPIDTKSNYVNVRNAYFLMRYYQYFSKLQEAKTFAKFVRDNGENFYELVDEAEEVLKIRVVKTQIETLAHETEAVIDTSSVKDISIEDLAVEKDEEPASEEIVDAPIEESKDTMDAIKEEDAKEEVQEESEPTENNENESNN